MVDRRQVQDVAEITTSAFLWSTNKKEGGIKDLILVTGREVRPPKATTEEKAKASGKGKESASGCNSPQN